MDFVANQEREIHEMLKTVGISSVEELFKEIPKALRLDPPVADDGMSEYEGKCLIEALAAKNSFPSYDNYIGASAYEHHVPAIVSAICSKSEFLTAYTPYQPEASQGMLQAIFEFQSAICTLTGLDVANASVYDGASAAAEALLMALRHQEGRRKICVDKDLHPNYRAVIDQYIKTEVHSGYDIDENTAAVLISYPNFLGVIEDISPIIAKAKLAGALVIIVANPLVYGLFASAGELGADIAVGDCQPFGISLQFGGPYAGYMACRQELVRQLPGRIVGKTVDTKGREGYVLTLQAREQHIRREKATSNICTNQALAALASLITMLWYGKEGIQKLALTNYQRADYLRSHLKSDNSICFNEFTVTFNQPAEVVQKKFRAAKIEPGLLLEDGRFLVAVTETKSQEQLDRYIKVAKELI